MKRAVVALLTILLYSAPDLARAYEIRVHIGGVVTLYHDGDEIWALAGDARDPTNSLKYSKHDGYEIKPHFTRILFDPGQGVKSPAFPVTATKNCHTNSDQHSVDPTGFRLQLVGKITPTVPNLKDVNGAGPMKAAIPATATEEADADWILRFDEVLGRSGRLATEIKPIGYLTVPGSEPAITGASWLFTAGQLSSEHLPKCDVGPSAGDYAQVKFGLGFKKRAVASGAVMTMTATEQVKVVGQVLRNASVVSHDVLTIDGSKDVDIYLQNSPVGCDIRNPDHLIHYHFLNIAVPPKSTVAKMSWPKKVQQLCFAKEQEPTPRSNCSPVYWNP